MMSMVFDRRVTFICGHAGVCALGAVAAKHFGDNQLRDGYLDRFREVITVSFALVQIDK